MIEIKGGADEFEAAVIAVVIDHVRAQEKAASSDSRRRDSRVPAWVRAVNREAYPDLRYQHRNV
jgi:hypothetical protein